jgi:hypothetical protein
MARPLHDEIWSTLSSARNMLSGVDTSRPSINVSTHQLKLILETFIAVADRNAKGADIFAKSVESRIESIGKAQAEHHGAFAKEQEYVANKIAAENA